MRTQYMYICMYADMTSIKLMVRIEAIIKFGDCSRSYYRKSDWSDNGPIEA